VKGPLVSVIVAVYNGERFLGATLESIFAQDYTPIEVIVVDDGSKDGSADIARSFEGVNLLRQANAGPAAARNAGLDKASGEFVAVVDADDVVPPDKLSVQISYLLDHPHVSCVLGRQEWIDPPTWLQRDAIYGELGGIPSSSAVLRADTLRQLDGYDPTFRTGEDMDLLIRMRERGLEIIVLPNVVQRRRFHGDNLSVVPGPPQQRLRSLKAKLDRSRREHEAEA
jgi:glycosyltransferase involved in cell wall biosynthesis